MSILSLERIQAETNSGFRGLAELPRVPLMCSSLLSSSSYALLDSTHFSGGRGARTSAAPEAPTGEMALRKRRS